MWILGYLPRNKSKCLRIVTIDIFSAQIRGRHGSCQTKRASICPHMFICPLYVCTFPHYIWMPHVHLDTPHVHFRCPHTFGCTPSICLNLLICSDAPITVQMPPICPNTPSQICMPPYAPLYICMFLGGICI